MGTGHTNTHMFNKYTIGFTNILQWGRNQFSQEYMIYEDFLYFKGQ